MSMPWIILFVLGGMLLLIIGYIIIDNAMSVYMKATFKSLGNGNYEILITPETNYSVTVTGDFLRKFGIHPTDNSNNKQTVYVKWTNNRIKHLFAEKPTIWDKARSSF